MSAINFNAPWSLELIEKWPFGVKVTDSNGDVVIYQTAVSHSTSQKTRKDCQDGVGFKPNDINPDFTRAAAISKVKQQDDYARLIAAAPDLLEALKALMDEVEEMTERCGWAGRGARMHAQNAIAKAEGR